MKYEIATEIIICFISSSCYSWLDLNEEIVYLNKNMRKAKALINKNYEQIASRCSFDSY